MFRRLWPVCLILIAWGCDETPQRHEDQPSAAQLLAENKPFEFDFDLEDVNGNRLSKADFAGKVLIVDVWGTWCPPCRMEIPHFVALNKEFHDQGLQVIGLNDERDDGSRKTAERTVREFCQAQAVDYPCALITRKVKQQIPRFGGFPTTLFLDRTGKVRLKLDGAYGREILQAIVEALLKESPPGGTADTDATEAPDDARDKPSGE